MPTPPRPPKPTVKAPVPPRPARKPKRKQYRLTEDVLSYFYDNKGRNIVYGRKGDIVTAISTHGEILAVEAGDGNRYSVRLTKMEEIISSTNQNNS